MLSSCYTLSNGPLGERKSSSGISRDKGHSTFAFVALRTGAARDMQGPSDNRPEPREPKPSQNPSEKPKRTETKRRLYWV